jgi:hypothetical protein
MTEEAEEEEMLTMMVTTKCPQNAIFRVFSLSLCP